MKIFFVSALIAFSPALSRFGGGAESVSEVEIRLVVKNAEVDLGKAFPLTVVRAWPISMTPAPWRKELLTPLQVQPREVLRREENGRIIEERRFEAYAFELGELKVPSLTFRANPRDGGPALQTDSQAIHLLVKGALDPAQPGEAELPAPLPIEPESGLLGAFVIVSGLAVLLGIAWMAQLRRKRKKPKFDSSRPPPLQRALQKINSLRRNTPTQGEDRIVELSNLLRSYLQDRFSWPASSRTTEEILTAGPLREALSSRQFDLLAQVMEAADRAMYSGAEPAADDWERLIDAAEQLLKEVDEDNRFREAEAPE